MKFKRAFLVLCMFLSLSFMVPESAGIVYEPLNSMQTITVAKAGKKAVKRKVVKKKTTKKKIVKKDKKTKKATVKAKKEAQVYVTPTGECYHTHACGRGSYSKAPLSSAKARGLRPCKKCY